MKTKRNPLIKRFIVLGLLTVTMAFSFVGETNAYFVASVDPAKNTFSGSYIDIAVSGSGGPATAYVKNNGNVPAYVRAVLVVNWVNEETNNWVDGNGNKSTTRQYLARAPVKGTSGTTYTNNDGTTSTVDYNYAVRTADWLECNVTETVGNTKVTYSIFYYRKPLAPGASTTTILTSFSAFNGTTRQANSQGTERTYNLTGDFLVDAIQCEAAGTVSAVSNTAVVQEWGVTLSAVAGNITAGPTTDFIPSLQ